MIEGNGAEIIGFSVAFTSLALIAIGLRLWVRFKNHSQGRDDLAIVLSGIVQIVVTILFGINVSYGLGAHFWTLSKADQQMSLKIYWIIFSILVPLFSLPKLAVAFQIERTLEIPLWHRLFIYANLLLLFLLGTTDVLLIWLQCTPSRIIYDFYTPGHCLSPTISVNVGFATAAYSAFLDFALAFYPAYRIATLNMRTGKKIQISILFAFGIIAGAISIAKCTQLIKLDTDPAITYDTTALSILTPAEADFLILAACIPGIAPIVRWPSTQKALAFIRRPFQRHSASSEALPETYKDISVEESKPSSENTSSV